MKNRKICAILIAAAFVVSAIFAFVLLSLVKKTDVRYEVSDDTDVSELNEAFGGLKGRSLWFLSEEDVFSIIDDYPYFYLEGKPRKVFPNVIRFTVKERREVYRLSYGDKIYVLDEDGVLLSIEDYREESRELITLRTEGISVKEAVPGKVLGTSDDAFFGLFLETAKAAELTDNIKSVTVLSETERKDFRFYTYTGVMIEIPDADDQGKEKTLAAFAAYNDSTDDYYKSFDKITAVKLVSGEFKIEWTEKSR